MGMFGASAPGAAFNPSAMSPQDRMMLVGAMMRDAGASLRGGEGNAVGGTLGLLAQRQLMNGVLGALDPGQPPQRTWDERMSTDPQGAPPAAAPGGAGMLNPRALAALSFVNPQAADALVNVQKLNETAVGPNGQVFGKYDPSMRGQNLSASQYLNGFKVNPNDRNSPAYVPAPPVEGAMPLFDQNGAFRDWYLPPGAERALDVKNKPGIMRGQAALAEVPIAARNAATSAAAQANTASQNVVAPPPGFVVRARRR